MNIARDAPRNYAFSSNESFRIDSVHKKHYFTKRLYFICVSHIYLWCARADTRNLNQVRTLIRVRYWCFSGLHISFNIIKQYGTFCWLGFLPTSSENPVLVGRKETPILILGSSVCRVLISAHSLRLYNSKIRTTDNARARVCVEA